MYYITRVLIPPLERIFNLVGADVRQWFAEMPRAKSMPSEAVMTSPSKRRKLTDDNEGMPASPNRWDVEEHLLSTRCLACGEPAFAGTFPFE